jgi:predicted dehydrogenase
MHRLRVGIVGCGLIAQVMHLPHLRELDDRFEIAALCDLSPGTLAAVGSYYGVDSNRRFSHWQDLVAQDLDAVMVFTAGSHHAPPAIAAAESGKHVLVEKPMCYTLREADAMVDAARRGNATLMVANMKRYDPAYQRAAPLISAIRDLRLVQVTTLEAPLLPYVQHHRLHRMADIAPEVLNTLKSEQEALLDEALGRDVGPVIRHVYADVLLDSLVHEINAVRGLLGDPESVSSAETWMGGEGVTAVLKYPGDLRCVLTWINLPELRHYSQELAFYGPADRVIIRLPSPFLRNEPTALIVEGMEDGAAYEKALTVSYEEAFKRELEHFYDCAVNGATPLTTGASARQDLAILQALARAMATGQPQSLSGI